MKASANPAGYASFSKLLSSQDQLHHALARLTFGETPRSAADLKQIGLARWLDEQLHPERIPENPVLEERLVPFESLRMAIHDTYVHYPPPRAIIAFARGANTLPDDPDLRAIIVQLAYRYYERRDAGNQGAAEAPDPNDPSDLELRSKLSDLLAPQQIELLKTGKPDEKRQVLAAIAPARGIDFAFSLRPGQRRPLFDLAPITLRRQLMLTVNPESVVADDLAEGKLLRAIYSNRQLAELLDDFWFNHFNVFLGKGAERYMVPTYEREAIRPHVLGKFYDLLLATAKSSAMLFYLDNWQSVSNDIHADHAHTNRRGKPRRGLNENYGRELLELHTLGVDGGYTQKDVVEVARCFTGWTMAGKQKSGGFEYNDKVHDKGGKTVLGHVIKAGGGINDGLEVLKILARPSVDCALHFPATGAALCGGRSPSFAGDPHGPHFSQERWRP